MFLETEYHFVLYFQGPSPSIFLKISPSTWPKQLRTDICEFICILIRANERLKWKPTFKHSCTNKVKNRAHLFIIMIVILRRSAEL